MYTRKRDYRRKMEFASCCLNSGYKRRSARLLDHLETDLSDRQALLGQIDKERKKRGWQ
jgi:hypothetical protein